MSTPSEDYIEVEVFEASKTFRIPREITEQFKGIIGKKTLRKMKREAVRCPVKGEVVPFLICYTCKNFIRRVRGVVHCRGKPLD